MYGRLVATTTLLVSGRPASRVLAAPPLAAGPWQRSQAARRLVPCPLSGPALAPAPGPHRRGDGAPQPREQSGELGVGGVDLSLLATVLALAQDLQCF